MTIDGSFDVGCGIYTCQIEAPPPQPELPMEGHCNVTVNTHYVSALSIYANHKEFCTKLALLGSVKGGTVLTETYNDNTPDQVRLIASFPHDGKITYGTQLEHDCNNLFKDFLHNCNIPGEQYSNPWMYNRLNYNTGSCSSRSLSCLQAKIL